MIIESGHEGYPLKLIITQLSGVPEMIPMAEAAFTYLSDIGIDVEAEEMEWARFRADFYRPGKTHGTIAPIRGTMRPAEVTLRFYNVSGPEGFQRIVPDPKLDELYQEAITAVNPEVKANALRQAGDIKFDEYAEVPIVWLPSQIAINPPRLASSSGPGISTRPSPTWSTSPPPNSGGCERDATSGAGWPAPVHFRGSKPCNATS